MNILIVGTGGVGGYYGARLVQAGAEVTFLARGATLATLQSKPLTIKSYQGDFTVPATAVASVDELKQPSDLIIFATKTYDTDAVIAQIAPAVSEDTLLLSLQNGVESEHKLVARFGNKNVLGGISYIGSEVIAPGQIQHSAEGRISIGELDGTLSLRVKRLGALFEKAGIQVNVTEKIQYTLWKKLLWNVPFNQACAIARASVGELLDSEPMKKLLIALGGELIEVAQASGIELSSQDMKDHMKFSEDKLRAVRPSLLQDLERGKRLEHETFGGFVVREGARLGVSVPVNKSCYQLLAFLDERSQ